MNIGLDVDGVLTDIGKFQIEQGEKYFGRKVINADGFSIRDMFECTEEEERNFWKKNLLKYGAMYKARNGSDRFTAICHNNDDKIIIVTSRVHATEDTKIGKLMRFVLEEWLKSNNIQYDEIVYCDGDKSEAIKEHNIDIMIEDNVDNINSLKDITRVICFDNPYNRELSEDIKRIYDMGKDAYYAVDQYKQEIMQQDVVERNNKLITVLSGKASIDRPWMKYYEFKDRSLKLPNMSVYEYLKQNADSYSKSIAINYFDRKITYHEMMTNIDKYAQAFRTQGVTQGDTVSLCLPNIPEAIYMFYGLNKIGAVANMIHPLKAANEIKSCINETNSKLLVMVDNAYEEVNKIIDQTVVRDAIVVSAGDSMPLPLKLLYKAKSDMGIDYGKKTKYMKLDKFVSSASKVRDLPEVSVKGNDTAVIMYTGGTSGFPKGVELSNNNFNHMVYQQKATAKHFGPGDTMLTIMPVFHGFGLCSSVHMPLSYGITTILIPKFDSKSFHKLIGKYKPNHIFGVPKLWKALMSDKKIQEMDLSFMRYVVSGGENMKDGLEEEINDFLKEHNCFYKVKKGYGLSEAVAGTTLSDDNCNEIGSVGIPLVCNDFKVVKPGTEEELGYNEEGEFCISGPSVMKGYINNIEETSKVLRQHEDGKVWLHTGDMGYMTEDGMIYYTDRLTRMYVSAGFNIYPPRIEKVIEENEKVEACATVPMHHPYKDVKVPKVYVILKENQELTEELKQELMESCKKNLDAQHQPYRFEQVTEFPLTNMGEDIGKIDYKTLEKMANSSSAKIKTRGNI